VIGRRFARLLPAANLESHDLVTTAVRTGRGDLDLNLLAEPLELICRDLERAHLRPERRRAARRLLLDALRSESPPEQRSARGVLNEVHDSQPATAPVVLVVGLPHSATSVVGALEASGHFDSTYLDAERSYLTPRLRSLEFEQRWHLPSWAEWFEGTDHTACLQPLTRRSSTRPQLIASWSLMERPGQLLDDAAGVVVVVRPDEHTVQGLIDETVRQRHQWADHVDDAAVRRYWRWRLDLMVERFDTWQAPQGSAVIEPTAAELERPSEIVEKILLLTETGHHDDQDRPPGHR